MGDLIPFVLSLGIADSLNPATLAVGLYLAATPKPLQRLTGYTLGIFGIYFLGGVLLIVGPAALLRVVTKGVDPTIGDVIALVAGVAAIVFAVLVWRRRARMQGIQLPKRALQPGSTLALGAAMTVVDLPTAFPLFIVVGTIAHEDLHRAADIVLVLIYCLAYIVPLAAILAIRAIGGERSERWLERMRVRVSKWAPTAIAVLSAIIGLILIGYGGYGLING
jgi:cytochrome c biogenesis protein CcdA